MKFIANATPDADMLFSWVKHYDGATKSKTPVTGMCLINTATMDMTVAILDEQRGVDEVWNLNARPCRQVAQGKRSPQLLATNGDLQDW
jgi:hypothetical protein